MARQAANSRIRPDRAGHSKGRPTTVLVLVGSIPAGWRVKDSNLGRHQPTDLQSAAREHRRPCAGSRIGAVCGPSQRTQRRSITRYDTDQRRVIFAGQRRSRGCDQAACLVSQKILSIRRTVPSPGGQISGIASYKNCCGWTGWAGCGIPSTSLRATTRQPEGRARSRTRRFHRGLPPGCRVVGLTVDGMPHEAPACKICECR